MVDHGELVSILTEHDILRAFLSMSGADQPGYEVTCVVGEGTDVLGQMNGTAQQRGLRLVSASLFDHDGKRYGAIHFTGARNDAFVEALWSSGHTILRVHATTARGAPRPGRARRRQALSDAEPGATTRNADCPMTTTEYRATVAAGERHAPSPRPVRLVADLVTGLVAVRRVLRHAARRPERPADVRAEGGWPARRARRRRRGDREGTAEHAPRQAARRARRRQRVADRLGAAAAAAATAAPLVRAANELPLELPPWQRDQNVQHLFWDSWRELELGDLRAIHFHSVSPGGPAHAAAP